MRNAKTGVALAALLTMSGVTMSKPKKPAPRRKRRPTEKERKLLTELSEQERAAQVGYKKGLAERGEEHKKRVKEATRFATDIVGDAKSVFDAKARKLSATRANALASAEREFSKGMAHLRTEKAERAKDAEEKLDAATLASTKQYETEAAALTNALNEDLSAIFAERESIEYGDKPRGEGL